MTTARDDMPEATQPAPAVGSRLDRTVRRPAPERAGFLTQIEACRREVARWPEWANHATDL